MVLGFLDIVLLAEPFNTAGSIHEFLLTRKEGVAGGTNFHLDILGGRTCFYNVPAGTGYLG